MCALTLEIARAFLQLNNNNRATTDARALSALRWYTILLHTTNLQLAIGYILIFV